MVEFTMEVFLVIKKNLLIYSPFYHSYNYLLRAQYGIIFKL